MKLTTVFTAAWVFCAALCLPAMAGADDFLGKSRDSGSGDNSFFGDGSTVNEDAEGGRGFFGEPEREQPGGADGTDSDTASSAQKDSASDAKRYSWYAALGVGASYDMNYGINYGPLISANVQWSPFSHIGIGVRFGIDPFSYPLHISNPNNSYNDTDQGFDFVTVADGDPDYLYSFYIVETGGNNPLFYTELMFSFFLNNNGLTGLYAGADIGLFISTASDPVLYFDSQNDEEVENLSSDGETLLPALSQFSPTFTPHIGYKLMLGGFTVDLKIGYMFCVWPHFGGITWAPTIGYSF